ncbi:major facilitator superfamily domain-containing protein [Mucor mucedo]|uniref:major facilitator superfamily domain-containing protein n=1 Tax=Mucor mucedo TaxID=29922 RepID=UPI0022207681|nr:major facilitator superfamily domain-containing protein [Mucor mucedo]KAI7884486.1 major facilitator superfamily domain-containing protein [Mucor mucedo]
MKYVIAPFISAVACPLWATIADKTKTHRYIMCIVHTLATVAIVSVMGISVVVQSIEEESERSKLTITLVTITSICFAFFGVPVGPLVDGGVLKILGRNKDQYGRQRMFGSISFGVASSLVGFITDWTDDMNAIFYIYACSAICFILVAGNTQFKSERIEDIFIPQSQNVSFPASSSSSSATATTTTAKIPRTSTQRYEGKMKQFQVDPYEEVGIDLDSPQIRQNEIQRLIQFATESSIIEAVNLSNPPSHRRRSVRLTLDEPATIIELLKKPEVSLFYLTMMLMGASLNMVISFLFIYLKQDLGASSSQVGLTGLIGSSTELVFFFYSRDLIRLFGIKSLVILGHVLTIIRVFAYTILPRSPTGASIALGLHLLNGIAFSALWGAGVVQADELSPPSLQATSQGLLAAMYAGVGAGLGSLVGGVIYEKYGCNAMFYTVIALTSISLEIYLEVNTRCALSHFVKWLYKTCIYLYKCVQKARGIGQAVPRWSGGRIRLNEDD